MVKQKTGVRSQKSEAKKKAIKPNLSVNIAGIEMKNPVMTASGTFGYGEEYSAYVDLNRLGAVVTKGLSARPRKGNPPPRICETASGMLNAIGLENVGAEAFIKEKLPFLRKYDTKIILNIFGNTIEEYVEVVEIFSSAEGISGLEVNISCPNVKDGGINFGTDPNLTARVLTGIRNATSLPVIAKLSPDVTDITTFAKIAEDSGCNAVSLINTLVGMAVDIRTRRPVLANITGGLSGPAIKPVALRMVWQAAKTVKIPVIGIGGIMTAEDAVEFLLAGAKAVQVGTANFINPSATIDIIEGIEEYLYNNSISDINQIIGKLQI
jgi:dihydroorotate dehydrogenase (NAD+) catalytic subunit